MKQTVGEGRNRSVVRRGMAALGGAALLAVGVLVALPAGAQTSTSTSTSTSSTSSTTSTTVSTSTTVPTAVTQTATPQFNCLGADPATTALLDSLGPSQGFTKGPDGHYYIVSNWTTSSSVPQFLENGQTFPVSFSASLDVSAFLANPALPAGAIIAVSGAPSFVISGGGSGGPFPGAPTSGSVTKGTGPQTLPAITASGTVTGVDKTQPIIYAMASPLLATDTITLPGVAPIVLNLSCTAVDPDIASTNGSLPPEPPTTTAPPAVATNPTFTG
jgi:hypothetical protein